MPRTRVITTISYSYRGITITYIGGVDYISGPYTVNFPAGDTTFQLSITIISDSILERDEQFELTISNSRPDRVDNRGSLRKTTVTIRDDDGKLTSLICE